MLPSTDWKEDVRPDEEQRFGAYAAFLRDAQRARASKRGGKADRALHAKANLGVTAELEVLADLPEEARAGLFATPARYPVYLRYSNGGPSRLSDLRPDVRGVAVKVIGAPGKKVIPGMEDARTQDFLLIRTPTTPVRNAAEFMALVRAARSPALAPIRLASALGVGRTFSILGGALAGAKLPRTPLASTRYFSAAPIACGRHAVKVAMFPHDADPPVSGGSDDFLGDGLCERLRRGPVVYDLRMQFFVDAATTPIEDASVEWPEAVSPWVIVARLTIPEQDAASPRGQRVRARVEQLSFDPWHACAEHRRLGDMMRARNHAYRLSTEERAAAKEPDTMETFD